jgi:flagellar biosynthesis component FlhA
MKKILFFALFAIILFGCKDQKTATQNGADSAANKTSTSSEQSVQNTPSQNQSSTNSARTKEVIFYTISTDELAAIAESQGEESPEITMIDEFDAMTNEFMESPGMAGLEIKVLDTKRFTVPYGSQQLIIERNNSDNQFGVVFNDGVQAPKVIKGLRSVDEYRKVAAEFFGTK